ncbi:MAG TPA: hypothetical protein VKR32_08785, partial [Puia sp.]|nr:hypothetical protein [Puia sp.]
MNTKRIGGNGIWLLVTGILASTGYAQLPSPDSTLRLMCKVADWQLLSWAGKTESADEKSDWVNAAAYTGIMALSEIAPSDKYIDAMAKIGESLSWETGRRKRMADDYCIG